MTNSIEAEQTQQQKRRKISPARMTMRVIFIIAATVWTADLLYTRSYSVVMNDARIASHVTSISSNLSGWIVDLPAKRGLAISKGDLLLKIDDRRSALRLEELTLRMAIMQSEIERSQTEYDMVKADFKNHYLAQEAKISSLGANRDKAQSALILAKNEFKRANTLLQKKLISQAQWEKSELETKHAGQNFQKNQADLNEATYGLQQVLASGKAVEILTMKIGMLQQELEALEINRNQQIIDLDDRQILSPIDGIIDKTFVNHGEYLSPGRRILMMHNPNDIWIDANLIETQISRIRLGMTATVKIDAYPDEEFTATVESIDNATTSEYALLPNPNPSGNFTKVTQRLRVKLAIEQRDNTLKPGMMVEVNIDTRS